MGDDLAIEFRTDHIHVTLGPDFRVRENERDEFWSALRAACEEHDSCRVLVEGFVPGGEHPTSEVIAAGQRAATIPHLWLAFHLENFVPDERSELFEAVAASRGVRVKFFPDAEHALNWLRNNAPG